MEKKYVHQLRSERVKNYADLVDHLHISTPHNLNPSKPQITCLG